MERRCNLQSPTAGTRGRFHGPESERERSEDATDRNNNLTPCSPEFPEPVVPIYESTFCLCGNKHFNLREGEGQSSCSVGETAE